MFHQLEKLLFVILAFAVLIQTSISIGRAKYYFKNYALLASEDEAKHIVSVAAVYKPQEHFCLGTVVRSNLVLTTARCISEAVRNQVPLVVIPAFKGGIGLKTKAKATNVTKIRLHPNFKFPVHQNDLAVLEIEKPLIYVSSRYIAQVFARETSDLPAYSECDIYGWGCLKNKRKKTIKQHLLKKKVYIYEERDCAANFGLTFFKNELCSDNIGNIFCETDNGGPLICDNKLIGIASFYSSDEDYVPNLFIRVGRYRDFIYNPVEYKVESSSSKVLLNHLIFIVILVLNTINVVSCGK